MRAIRARHTRLILVAHPLFGEMIAIGHQNDDLHRFRVGVIKGAAVKHRRHNAGVDEMADHGLAARIDQRHAPFHARIDRGGPNRREAVDLGLQRRDVLRGQHHRVRG